MRTATALVVIVAALAGMVSLLMHEGAQFWQLGAVGTVAGVLVSGIRWGWRGAAVGAAVGCALGLVAPLLYIPFWLAFTLPPHPKVDL